MRVGRPGALALGGAALGMDAFYGHQPRRPIPEDVHRVAVVEYVRGEVAEEVKDAAPLPIGRKDHRGLVKLPDQFKSLNETRMQVAVATPHRAQALCDAGALRLSDLKCVVLDLGLDEKKDNLLTNHQLRKPLVALFQTHLQDVIMGGQARVGLF